MYDISHRLRRAMYLGLVESLLNPTTRRVSAIMDMTCLVNATQLINRELVRKVKHMKVAEIYSICGEHTAWVGGKSDNHIVWRMSEDAAGLDPDELGDDWMKASALVIIDRCEKALRDMGVTHCVDLVDPEDGPQEEPVEIGAFMECWRKHVETNYP